MSCVPVTVPVTTRAPVLGLGRFSSALGEANINIATFHVGREAPGGSAIALIEIDGEMPADVLALRDEIAARRLPVVELLGGFGER